MDITAVLTFITPVHLAMIPIVVGLVGVFKLFQWFNNAYSAVLSIVFGLLLAWLLGGTIVTIIIAGLVIGLMAAGLYSGTSAIKRDLTA